jgi:hypothetical protein
VSPSDALSLFSDATARVTRGDRSASTAAGHAASLIPRARRSDPRTSHDAAESFSREAVRVTQQKILELLADGPMSDTEIADRYAQHHTWPRQSPSGLRTRRAELVHDGRVRDTGDRVVLPSGRKSIVWALTEGAGIAPGTLDREAARDT